MTDLLQTGYSALAFPSATSEQLAARPTGAGAGAGGAGSSRDTPFLDTLEDWAERRSAEGESGNIPRNSALPPGTPDLRCPAAPRPPPPPHPRRSGALPVRLLRSSLGADRFCGGAGGWGPAMVRALVTRKRLDSDQTDRSQLMNE